MKLSFFLIILFINYFSCHDIKNNFVLFELPCDYSGRVTIEFDCINYTKLNTDQNGNIIVKIDSSGKSFTSTTYLEFLKYKREKYHWQCEDSSYEREINSSRVAASWSGGRGELNRIQSISGNDTITTYTSDSPTKLTYYCTYVSKIPTNDSFISLVDSLKKKKCDCDSYPEELPSNLRCR